MSLKFPEEKWFRFHKGTAQTIPLHSEVRLAVCEAAEQIGLLVPQGPERTLALRKLQEAMFYANAGIALHLSEPE